MGSGPGGRGSNPFARAMRSRLINRARNFRRENTNERSFRRSQSEGGEGCTIEAIVHGEKAESVFDRMSSDQEISEYTPARSSAKTGAAITRPPRPRASSRAERASVFRESSSFQRATRMLVSIAVVIARAVHAPIARRPFCRDQCYGSRCPDIFQKGS
jgi:hypothetical protein